VLIIPFLDHKPRHNDQIHHVLRVRRNHKLSNLSARVQKPQGLEPSEDRAGVLILDELAEAAPVVRHVVVRETRDVLQEGEFAMLETNGGCHRGNNEVDICSAGFFETRGGVSDNWTRLIALVDSKLSLAVNVAVVQNILASALDKMRGGYFRSRSATVPIQRIFLFIRLTNHIDANLMMNCRVCHIDCPSQHWTPSILYLFPPADISPHWAPFRTNRCCVMVAGDVAPTLMCTCKHDRMARDSFSFPALDPGGMD
jgi:hypothetical protein